MGRQLSLKKLCEILDSVAADREALRSHLERIEHNTAVLPKIAAEVNKRRKGRATSVSQAVEIPTRRRSLLESSSRGKTVVSSSSSRSPEGRYITSAQVKTTAAPSPVVKPTVAIGMTAHRSRTIE